ncbi:hypothetical protein [Streptomyces sp. V4I2]|uniref:hypothetical protein n=1 Tax=Streptomyces sp. V4I2 TaxID=3042280 RepID=UPI00278358BF|nr:hypothetical protein [Streptomyces sp. V4I2]MDQ1045482.1 hypothetical protein [Streptomyces sp. V4I2]
MGRSSMRARMRTMRQRVIRTAQGAPTRLRRRAAPIDIWIQDHHIALVIAMFVALFASAGLLLWTNWDLVIDLARQLAPVLTIFSITATAILSVIRWFRARQAARLARRETAAVPQPRSTSTDTPEGAGTAQTPDCTRPGGDL